MKTMSEIRKEYGITNSYLAKIFGYKNVWSFNRSSGKVKVFGGIMELVSVIEGKMEKKSSESLDSYPRHLSYVNPVVSAVDSSLKAIEDAKKMLAEKKSNAEASE